MPEGRHFAATLWSAADLLLRQGVQFFVSVLLARLLSPEEFGTIALLYLFTGIAGAFVEGGMSSALIQRQDVTPADESTVFWMNLVAALISASALYLAAPWIAAWFGKPVLEPLTRILSINLIVSALGSLQTTLFTKRLDFRPIMFAGASATVLSGAAAVAMAWAGHGVWALASQTLIASGVTTALLWMQSKWRPSFVFSGASVRRLFRFGGFMLASALLDITFNQCYALMIGKMYGVRDLGQYSRAQSTAQPPSALLNGIIGRVAFPAFSMASSPERLRHVFRLALQSVMLLNAPAMLGLAAVAEPLVLTLFGKVWLPAVPIMRVLCLAGLLMPLHVLNLQALMALGRSDLFFRLEVVKKMLGIGLLWLGSSYGAIGVAWGMVAAGVLSFFINALFARKLFGYGTMQQLLGVLPAVAASATMAAAVMVFGGSIDSFTPPARLGIEVGFGIALFLALSASFRLPAFSNFRDALSGARARWRWIESSSN